MQRMNPVTGAIKFLLSTTLNTVLALVFFLAVAHFQTPTFVGRVAIIQLLELIASSALTYLSPIIYTREISQSLAKHTPDTAVVGTVLTSILVATPTLLILLLFPTYIWLSIPYLALYVYSNTLANIAAARGLFTQSAISAAIFSVGRWGLSAIPAYYGSVPLLILIWTAGAAVKTAYLHLAVRGLPLKPHFSLAKQIFIEGLPLYISITIILLKSGRQNHNSIPTRLKIPRNIPTLRAHSHRPPPHSLRNRSSNTTSGLLLRSKGPKHTENERPKPKIHTLSSTQPSPPLHYSSHQ